ncbi:MAG TPA: hypothetical protein VFU94_07485 [Conexibacter sp.]|nr:hypothetical protein [Conexibacter sp.]
MTRRRALWLLALAVVATFAVEYAYDRQMQDAGGHGIVAFEVAFTHARAHEILTAWGSDGRRAARLSLWFDFAFMAAYGAFLFLAARALRDALARRGRAGLARPGGAVAALALVAVACDAFENVWLLLQLDGRARSVGPTAAGAFASVKFACLAVVLAYLLAGLAALALGRRRSITAR